MINIVAEIERGPRECGYWYRLYFSNSRPVKEMKGRWGLQELWVGSVENHGGVVLEYGSNNHAFSLPTKR
jgi:hypothetical protein